MYCIYSPWASVSIFLLESRPERRRDGDEDGDAKCKNKKTQMANGNISIYENGNSRRLPIAHCHSQQKKESSIYQHEINLGLRLAARNLWNWDHAPHIDSHPRALSYTPLGQDASARQPVDGNL